MGISVMYIISTGQLKYRFQTSIFFNLIKTLNQFENKIVFLLWP